MSARTGNDHDVLTLSDLARLGKKKRKKRAINRQSQSESSDSLVVKRTKGSHEKVLVEPLSLVLLTLLIRILIKIPTSTMMLIQITVIILMIKKDLLLIQMRM